MNTEKRIHPKWAIKQFDGSVYRIMASEWCPHTNTQNLYTIIDMSVFVHTMKGKA